MDTERQKAILLSRRRELVGHLVEVGQALDETPTRDLEDFATERQGDEVLEALGQAELDEVTRIDAALGRVNDGTYGLCLNCAEPISDARLDVLPETALCRNCAARNG
ncbi:TraR/DksA family transcriptional regulator [uncultured Roseobacter sp.]|uniref:TraR/DksA family transcriptional regulator n=1 Tax=uncultured Roseobacter sp. TaxID=114847 RepID=UPI002606AF24|nr:TraR/DksA family transcriptional regulator [uncultured Roseobacter sp.]